MTTDELKALTKAIVAEARRLNAAHTDQAEAPVNYACIFAQSSAEYEELLNAARQLGSVADDTATGPVFHIPPLLTEAGTLRLLKIRRPDPKRLEEHEPDTRLCARTSGQDTTKSMSSRGKAVPSVSFVQLEPV